MTSAVKTVWLIHGWSYTPALWDAVAAALSGAPLRLERVDLGYFGPEHRPVGRPDLVVGHSFGSLWALMHPDLAAVPVLAVNGFTRFAAAPDFAAGVAPRGLARMIRGISSDAAAVLAGFRAQIGDAAAVPEGPPESGRLIGDLERLRDDIAALHAAPLTALAGDGDPLIPPDHSRACFGDSVRFVSGGGHLLPLTHPAVVADAIRACLP
ncbi:alpha/beta fold hydrolase [Novispirillum itersonii]|uniref:Pimeloyl-[acyl-carrier protein] methyl ester esterase n=1 Tax=Novispirillum itersonii TaxID=189 RepID=A0A7X0DN33_NOVIT|nr:alpha/beta fold hydrolase [Novispirillum itersonii]MBB6211681.1 pimeloyl-[acyl-carrier protein] methyl ester esterase [Novispirillum itersonii]